LPEALRMFAREAAPPKPVQTSVPPPTIRFPPNGATLPLAKDDVKHGGIQLTADGGSAPLTWLVNGHLVGNADRFTPADYVPSGEGFARVTVVDAQGRSDSSQVRFRQFH
jgi:penicillin-binding protein 1C